MNKPSITEKTNMNIFIENIEYESEHITPPITIKTNQKNVIITGGNGCGKTSFLDKLNNKIVDQCVQKNHNQEESLKQRINYYRKQMQENARGTQEHSQAKRSLAYTEKEIEKYNNGLVVEFNDINEFTASLEEGKAIYKFFIATRTASIQESSGASKVSLEEKIEQGLAHNQTFNLGAEFENHLVNMKTRQSFAKTYDNDTHLYNSLQRWFDDLESNIAFLMEDDSFRLTFDPNRFKFYLNQNGKAPYTFQTLSSGYSSIFSIISELIMMTEAYKTSPSELQGIVLVDEIDAHLHVSLQRKILPFLTRVYPKIQFIVSTHSPFVIGSLDDAIIYDMSSRQQFSDLSNYSYESIIEGLLGVPVVSISLEKDIKRLSALINNENTDIVAIKELVDKLIPHEEKLDDESAVFFLKARRVLRDNKGGI
ncbi:AAA family ATPase [Serratia marcescens]|uniref:AAA family ATPase n=1 Tax=Serratia marcescens TaxID=615 RepID=UPI001F156854|nr:AAA family ATPase [Serratia marcescens]